MVEVLGLDLQKQYATVQPTLTPESFGRRLKEYLEQEGCKADLPPSVREHLYEEAIHCGKIVSVCEKMRSIVHADDFAFCSKQTKKLIGGLKTILSVANLSPLRNARQFPSPSKFPLTNAVCSWTKASLYALEHELGRADMAISQAEEFKRMGRLEIESLLLMNLDDGLKDELRGTEWERRRGKLRAAFAYASQLLPKKDVEDAVAMRISRAKTAKTANRITDPLFVLFF